MLQVNLSMFDYFILSIQKINKYCIVTVEGRAYDVKAALGGASPL
jgi:hypothetical protein